MYMSMDLDKKQAFSLLLCRSKRLNNVIRFLFTSTGLSYFVLNTVIHAIKSSSLIHD